MLVDYPTAAVQNSYRALLTSGFESNSEIVSTNSFAGSRELQLGCLRGLSGLSEPVRLQRAHEIHRDLAGSSLLENNRRGDGIRQDVGGGKPGGRTRRGRNHRV